MNGKVRILAAGFFVAIVAGTAWWILSRGESRTVVSAESGLVGPGEERLPAPEGVVFDIRPREGKVGEAARQVRERIEAAALGGPLGGEQATELAEAAAGRVAIMLSSSFDEWIAEVSRYTGRPDLDASGRPDPEYAERWVRQARGFRLAPIASEGIAVRPVFQDGEYLNPPVTGSLMRAVTRANYPRPRDPRSERMTCYEVLVPMLMLNMNTEEHELPVQLGLTYRWDPSSKEWVPFDLTVYLHQTGDAEFLLPVF